MEFNFHSRLKCQQYSTFNASIFTYLKIVRNFLFRYRGQLPLIIISIVFLLGLKFPIPLVRENSVESYRWFSLSLVALGIIYRCWTVGYSMQHASGRNRHQQVAHYLNQKGTQLLYEKMQFFFAYCIFYYISSLFQWK